MYRQFNSSFLRARYLQQQMMDAREVSVAPKINTVVQVLQYVKILIIYLGLKALFKNK